MFNRPKPVRKALPLEALTFDPRLQIRACSPGLTCDDATAAGYAEAMERGETFPPLEVVCEERKGRQPVYWIFAGFTRGEAYRRRSVGSVECLVYSGTFKDAEFYALSENSRHGAQRTPAECRAAFDRLIDSTAHLERVLTAAKNNGGTERALAAACGISHGAVGKYLRERGLHPDRITGKLVPNTGPASPEREARIELVNECAEKGLSVAQTAKELGLVPNVVKAYKKIAAERTTTTPAARQQSNADERQYGSILSQTGVTTTPVQASAPVSTDDSGASSDAPVRLPARTPAPQLPTAPTIAVKPAAPPKEFAETTIEEVLKLLRDTANKTKQLLRSKAGDRLKATARQCGVPFQVDEVDIVPLIPRKGDSLKKMVTQWPALRTMQNVFEQLRMELATADLRPERD